MSDSIKGQIPDLEEEQLQIYADSFIVTSIDLQSRETGEVVAVSGSVTGISLESRGDVKIDIKTSLTAAYTVLKLCSKYSVVCHGLRTVLDKELLSLETSYSVISAKIIEIEHEHKMCVLGLDLVKI